MNASAVLAADVDRAGRTRLTTVRSVAPLLLRETPGAVYLVGGAAGPLGGDDLEITVELAPGARLTLRTAAASVALPGPSPSRLAVRVLLGAGAHLRWLPEPTVAAAGCDHRVTVVVTMDERAGLVWREELVLGRHGEAPGSVSSRLHVDRAGRPLVRQHLAVGPAAPGWDGPAVAGRARAVGSLLVVDPALADGPARATVLDRAGAAVLPLAGPGVQVTAVAPDARTLRRRLDAGWPIAAPA